MGAIGAGRDSIGVAVEIGDAIKLSVWSSIACTFRGMLRIRPLLGKTASYPIEVTTPSTRATASVIYKIESAGVIDSVMIEATPKGTESAPTQRGQSYAKLEIQNGGCLSCGYVYPGHQPALNEFVEPGPAGGPGAVTRVTNAATVTTGRVLAVVPTGAIWKWKSGSTNYTASATVGTRAARCRFRDALGNSYHPVPTLAGVASSSSTWSWSENLTAWGLAAFDGSGALPAEINTPPGPIPAGHDLFVIDTAAIDGLDTCSMEGQVEEWVVPN